MPRSKTVPKRKVSSSTSSSSSSEGYQSKYLSTDEPDMIDYDVLGSGSEEESSSLSDIDKEDILWKRHVPSVVPKSAPTPASEKTRSVGLGLLHSFLDHDTIVSDMHDLFRHWVRGELPLQVASRKVTFKAMVGGQPKTVDMRFMHPRIEPPTYTDTDGVVRYLLPAQAIAQDLDYSARIMATPYLFESGKRLNPIESLPEIEICSILLPVLSDACNLDQYRDDPQELAKRGHNPEDPGTWTVSAGKKIFEFPNEHLRIDQMMCLEPGSKVDTTKRVVQYFITHTASIMMKVVKDKFRGDVMLTINAFGEQPNYVKADVRRAYRNNAINVIQVAALIIGYYRTSKHDIPEDRDVERMMTNYIRLFCPRPANRPNAVEKVLEAFSNTREVFRSQSMKDVVHRLMTWKKMEGLEKHRWAVTIRQIVERDIFPTATNAQAKIAMLANMTARYLAFDQGIISATNLNTSGNRKWDPYAFTYSGIFRNAFGRQMNMVQIGQNPIHGTWDDYRMSTLAEVAASYKSKNVTDDMNKPYKPTRGGGDSGKPRPRDLTQAITSTNPIDILTLITTTHVPTSKLTKSMEIRAYEATAQASTCPFTNDNDLCGLRRPKALTARMSVATDHTTQISELRRIGIVGSYEQGVREIPVFFNALPIGFCADGVVTQDKITRMRRLKNYPVDNKYGKRALPVSIIKEKTCCVFTRMGHLELYSNSGRLCKAVAYVENGQLIMFREDLTHLKSFAELNAAGAVGYVDDLEAEQAVFKNSPEEVLLEATQLEEFNIRISELREQLSDLVNRAIELGILDDDYYEDLHNYLLDPENNEMPNSDQFSLALANLTGTDRVAANEIIDRLRYMRYTRDNMLKYPVRYCLLHAAALVGAAMSLTAKGEYQIAVRGVYATKFITQTIPTSGPQWIGVESRRTDYGVRPIFGSSLNDQLGQKNACMGKRTNIMLATMRFNQEDAFCMSEGYAKTLHYTRTYVERINISGTERIERPPADSKHSAHSHRFLTSRGLPIKGEYYSSGDCILGRMVVDGDRKINRSVYLEKHQEGRVVSYNVYNNPRKGGITVEITLEVVRTPQAGDKFGVTGQKFTIGKIYRMSEMPYIVNGSQASIDVIINPHAIPSRMTVGMFIEMLFGRVSNITGLTYDGTMFEGEGNKLDACYKVLEENGMNPSGLVEVIDPSTGTRMKGQFFTGTCQVLQLHHLAIEKTHGCSVNKATNIGLKHKVGSGGRFGEMEKDVGLATGVYRFLTERLSTSADAINAVVCNNCGLMVTNVAVANCEFCGADSTVSFKRTTMPLSFKSIMLTSMSTGVFVRPSYITEKDRIERLKAELLQEEKRVENVMSYRHDEDYDEDSSRSEEAFESQEDEEIEEEDEDIFYGDDQ